MLTIEETKKKLLEIYEIMEKPVNTYDLLYELYSNNKCNRTNTRMALVDLVETGKIEISKNE